MWKEIYKKYLQLVQQSGDHRPSDEFYLKKNQDKIETDQKIAAIDASCFCFATLLPLMDLYSGGLD